MKQMQLRAMAKINLGLDVIRKREDGYHEVKMIMQTVRMFDRIILTRDGSNEITLESNLSFLPLDQNNIAYRAASLLMEKYQIKEGLHIYLQKRIPVAAGMAGGSADAAAVLYGVNRMFELGCSMEELRSIGVTIGADVPYCLMRGTVLSEGIGEILTPIAPCPFCYVLIAKPAISVSTKFVYENLHAETITKHPDIDALVRGIEHGKLEEMIPHMGNVLERVTIPAYPIIGEIKEKMLEYGAIHSLMSGSGPTVFGLFKSEEEMMKAKEKMLVWGKAPLVYATQLFQPDGQNRDEQ